MSKEPHPEKMGNLTEASTPHNLYCLGILDYWIYEDKLGGYIQSIEDSFRRRVKGLIRRQQAAEEDHLLASRGLKRCIGAI